MSMPERSVTFGTYNSSTNFGVLMGELTIGAPEPQTYSVEVPFRDGYLDETEYFGNVRFKNREISIDFYIPYGDDYEAVYAAMAAKIHGQRLPVFLSWNPDWYYEGRVTMGDLAMSSISGYWGFTVTVDADPYKYQLVELTYTISGSASYNLPVDRKPSVPRFKTTTSLTVTHNGSTYTFNANKSYDPELILTQDNNKITISGTGSVTISYTKGKF